MRKLRICHAWDSDSNLWGPGIIRIYHRKRIWNACSIVTGVVFAVIALICLTILGHNLKHTKVTGKEQNDGISNDEEIAGACEE